MNISIIRPEVTITSNGEMYVIIINDEFMPELIKRLSYLINKQNGIIGKDISKETIILDGLEIDKAVLKSIIETSVTMLFEVGYVDGIKEKRASIEMLCSIHNEVLLNEAKAISRNIVRLNESYAAKDLKLKIYIEE